MIRFVTGGACG